MSGDHEQPSGEGKARVLYISTEMWLSTARQAMALASLGCDVLLLAPPSHPALVTGTVSEFHRLDPIRPVRCIRQTLLQTRPDVLIPADERAVIHLQELWLQCETKQSADCKVIIELLLASVGSREAFFAARSRMHILELAQKEQIAIPQTVCVDREVDLEPAVQQLGLPLVLKADMTSGGDGVHIVRNLGEAHRSWRKLHNPPNLVRVIRRGVLFKNWSHLRSWVKREALAITAQKFVEGGSERTSMAVCHKGRVLASACLEVAKTWQERGPSSVLRILHDPVMETAIARLAARLNLSGFCGFDFMVTADGEPLLIEMNPRPTQTAHLALGAGRDLMAAFVRGMLGRKIEDRPAITAGDTVALFPQELIRDAESEYVSTAHHDVPWESPELMQRALKPLPQMITDDPRWRGGNIPPQ